MPDPLNNNPTTEELEPGQYMAGFTIEKKIGEGAMAILYLVTDKEGNSYSLKVPRQRFGVDPVSLVAFENEIRLAPYLKYFPHAHKPHVIHDGDNKYLLMEYIEGVDLWTHMNRTGVLNEDEAITLIKKVVFALMELHKLRIIHLDIKLSNIMITTTGEVRLIDFGLANHLDLPDLIHESFHEPKGTPCYIAPEQFIGVRDDVRSDIFSLGVMLFEMTTNNLPFGEGNTALDVINRIKKNFFLPGKYRPELSETFNFVVGTCLYTNPEMRFSDMDHLYEMLGMWEGELSVDSVMGYGQKRKDEDEKSKTAVSKMLKPAYRVIRNMFDTSPDNFQRLKQWAEYRKKSQKDQPYRMLVAILLDSKMQLTPLSREIVEEAYHLARLQKTTITIVTAIENDAGMASGESEAQQNNELCNKARLAINSLVEISADSGLAVGINVQVGSPVEVINICIENYHVDLLIIGSSKPSGFRNFMRNSNRNSILASINCNTYIVKEGHGIASKRLKNTNEDKPSSMIHKKII
ncbi:MAG: bifunctional serine/threonine-protein kinase/universal stress protein [Gammaproteobacteria bacterium]|nr:bifunctional serine/threonine-protein kinase/universal stress protein [Gammaproteobacteria bacterium]